MTAGRHGILAAVVVGLLAATLLSGEMETWTARGTADLGLALAAASSAVLVLDTARSREHGARMWRLTALTFVLLCTGRVLHLLNDVVRQAQPFPGPGDVFVVTASALSIVALLAAPGPPRRGERLTVALDGSVVALVALLAFWVGPGETWWAASPHPPVVAGVALAYPVLVGTGTSSIVIFLVFYDHRYARSTVALMLLSMGLMALGTLLHGRDLLLTPEALPGHPSSLLLTAGVLLVGTTALVADPVTEPEPRQTAPILLPLAAMLVGLVVTVGALATDRADLPTLVGAGLLFALLGTRNALTLARHRDLVESLNLTVARGVDELNRERARFLALAEHQTDLVMVVDARGEVLWQSPSVQRLLASEGEQPLGDGGRRAIRGLFVRALDAGGDPVSGEVHLRMGDGSTMVVEVVAVDLTAEQAVGGVVLTGRDVTERRRLTDDLAHQASHDPLTGLANRTLLHEQLALAIAGDDGRGRVRAVCIDLDGFKAINDTMGHAAGDELLCQVASRVSRAVRGDDLVARVGGDEFVVLLTDAGDDAVDHVAARMVESLREAYWLEEVGEALVHASVGIATADAATSTVDDLLARADVAMYAAKQRGGDRWVHFEPSMDREDLDRMRTAVALRHAIEDRRLRVVLQPVVELATGRTAKVEALARWDDDELGSVSPGVFVPLAEELGLVRQLGRLVLDLALGDLRRWVDRHGDGAPVLTVNASSREVAEPAYAAWVLASLDRHGLMGPQLELELTERVLVDVGGPALTNLEVLRAGGVRIAVDDFGTGYSSLSTLHELPVDVLKIDRAFVDQLKGGPADEQAIAAIVVRLAESLGLDVVAEGVETEAQAETLRGLGCQYGQGWHFARPAPLQHWLDQRRAAA